MSKNYPAAVNCHFALYNKLQFKKSRPSVNFINVLRVAFTCADPKGAKKTVKLSVFFYAVVASQMLMRLTPRHNSIEKSLK
jgi:hypothetical protein